MRRKVRKRLFCMAAIMVMTVAGVCQVQASEDSESDKGSIRIVLKDLETEESQRDGVEFSLWKVGTAGEKEPPVFDDIYEVDHFPQDSASLDSTARKIAELIKRSPDRTELTNQEGITEFNNLKQGIYLIQAAADNTYGKISPFLVLIPYWEEVDGQMEGPVYQIISEPKASPNVPEPEEPEKPDQVKTGDESRPILWTVLLGAGLALSAGVLIAERSRRKEENKGGKK